LEYVSGPSSNCLFVGVDFSSSLNSLAHETLSCVCALMFLFCLMILSFHLILYLLV